MEGRRERQLFCGMAGWREGRRDSCFVEWLDGGKDGEIAVLWNGWMEGRTER